LKTHNSAGLLELPEILHGFLEAVGEVHFGLPAEVVLGKGNVGLPLFGVVGGEALEDEFGGAAHYRDDLFGQLEHGKLGRVSDVDGARKFRGGIHHADEAVDEVVDIAERAGLQTVAVDGDVLAAKGLHDEVAHHAAVVRVHARPIGVEYAHDLDFNLVLPVVVEKEGFGAALAFVIAGSYADGVYVAPVAFDLGMDRGIAVHFTRRGLEDTGAGALGEAEHVDGAVYARLGCLDGIVLIVGRAGRAGEVEYAVHFDIIRKGDVVADELEIRVSHEVGDVPLLAGKEVVKADDVVFFLDEPVAKVASQESGTAGDESTGIEGIVLFSAFHRLFPLMSLYK